MSNYLSEMPSGVHEVLWQLFKNGPTFDGDLVCKQSRNWLKDQGYCEQSSGYNFLTALGVDFCISVGMDARKQKIQTNE